MVTFTGEILNEKLHSLCSAAHLNVLGNLFKDTEKSQISVAGLARTFAPSFRNLQENLSIRAAFEVSISLNILITQSFLLVANQFF